MLVLEKNMNNCTKQTHWQFFICSLILLGDNGYEKSESDTMGQDPSILSDPWTWCKCGKCFKMQTEKECLCCKEVESVRYFDLHGNWGLAVQNVVSEKLYVVDAFLPSNIVLISL